MKYKIYEHRKHTVREPVGRASRRARRWIVYKTRKREREKNQNVINVRPRKHFPTLFISSFHSQLQKIIVKFFFCCFHLMMMKNSFSFNISRKEVFILRIIFDCWALANSSTSITSHSIHRNRRSLWRHYSPILLLFFDFFDANWVRDERFIETWKRSHCFSFNIASDREVFSFNHASIDLRRSSSTHHVVHFSLSRIDAR